MAKQGARSCLSRRGVGASLGVQWLRLHTPNAGGLGSLGQGTRSHMPQLRVCMLQLKSHMPLLKTSRMLRLGSDAAKQTNIVF